jgi:hypothetical protein
VRRGRAIALRAIAIVVGLLLFIAVAEAGLRVVYRDGGTRTLGGPGGRSFLHDTIDGELRGRRDLGPKTPGVPRVMVVGDSITYGLGVRDWKATWPERLAQALERAGRPHQFAVFAVPGNDMPQHLDVVRAWTRQVQPDVFVYQWYVNDIEAISHRPDLSHPWQRWPWHRAFLSKSYLYFVLDHRLSQFVVRPHRTYVDYLKDFTPGSLEWTEFEREFHEFALHAALARRRIMMLYPQVPYRTVYPLQALHDRMRTLAGAHEIEIPPLAWSRRAGLLVGRPDAVWRQVVSSASGGALVIQTRDYVFAPGEMEIRVRLATHSAQSPGTVELIDVDSDTVVAAAALPGDATQSFRDATARFTLPGDRLRRLAVRVSATGTDEVAVADVKLPVDYGFEVIDLTEALNQFNTHASSFDAHPNERAHAVIADRVYAAISGSQ